MILSFSLTHFWQYSSLYPTFENLNHLGSTLSNISEFFANTLLLWADDELLPLYHEVLKIKSIYSPFAFECMLPSTVLNGNKWSQGFAEMAQFHLNQLGETILLRVYSETKNFIFILCFIFLCFNLSEMFTKYMRT